MTHVCMNIVSLCWSTKYEYKIWLPFQEHPTVLGVCIYNTYVYIYIYVCTYVCVYVFNVAELLFAHMCTMQKIAGAQLRAITKPSVCIRIMTKCGANISSPCRPTHNSQ
jgi:hypothetical protein